MGTQNRSESVVLGGLRDLRRRAREPRRRGRRRWTNQHRAPLTKEQQDLAIRYLPLARALARRFKDAWALHADEFESAACLALVEAAQAYDAAKNVKFATFARKRIVGELRDVQRDLKLPGWTRNVADAPTVVPLAREAEACGRVLMAEPDPPVEEGLEAHERLENMMRQLPGKHAAACREIYLGGLNQVETAAALGMSQARICTLHKQSMEMLSEALSRSDLRADAAALGKRALPPGAAAHPGNS